MRPKGSAEVLEARRRRAMQLLREKWSLQEVARRIGCAASSVMRWRDTVRRGGQRALRVRSAPGRPPKLSGRQHQELVRLLLRGAGAHGYRTELWTTARVAELISRRFGVHYHRDHVGRLLHQLGWSHQKPERRAGERGEAAIARWKHVHWPAVKKAARLKADLVFADESGFLLLPPVLKTWAPRGCTPLLRHRTRRDKISVISGISVRRDADEVAFLSFDVCPNLARLSSNAPSAASFNCARCVVESMLEWACSSTPGKSTAQHSNEPMPWNTTSPTTRGSPLGTS